MTRKLATIFFILSIGYSFDAKEHIKTCDSLEKIALADIAKWLHSADLKNELDTTFAMLLYYNLGKTTGFCSLFTQTTWTWETYRGVFNKFLEKDFLK